MVEMFESDFWYDEKYFQCFSANQKSSAQFMRR